MRSSGPLPCKPSNASSTSSEWPQARPSGRSIAVSNATVGQPRASPRPIMVLASSIARAGSGMNAPLPVFTSSTRPFSPSASFFDMMLAEMSGNGFHRPGHVPQRVELPVRRRDFRGLPQHGAADPLNLGAGVR